VSRSPSLPHPRQDLMSRPLEEELALFDVEAGEVHTLNASAAVVWMTLEGAREREELVEALMETFELDREDAEEGVEEALESFRQAGLLEGS